MLKTANMKKAYITIGLIFISISLFSQSYYRSYDHHDISMSYGLFTPAQFTDVNTPILNDMFPAELYVADHYKGSGAIFLTYRHMFRNENIFWGLTAGMSKSSWQIYNIGSDVGELKRQFYTFAIEFEYRYRNQGVVQMYSGVGLGFTYGSETLTSTDPGVAESTGSLNQLGYQVNAIGVRIGKKFGGFAEFGYGYKGIINIGLSLQLF